MDNDRGERPSEYAENDRHILFDVPIKRLKCCVGEKLIDRLDSVEDTKGNPNETGVLVLTNLRLVWYPDRKSLNSNLSIGLECVQSITPRVAQSMLVHGDAQTVVIQSKLKDRNFEFVFTRAGGTLTRGKLGPELPEMFHTMKSVHRAYATSKIYRELKMRGALFVNDGGQRKLDLLPREKMYEQIKGVMNLSSEQGVLGTMYLTSVRMLWSSDFEDRYNLSLPFIQLKEVFLRKTKYGPALVLNSRMDNVTYSFGFRIDPSEKLREACGQVQRVWKVTQLSPEFGVRISVERESNDQEQQEALMKSVEEEDIVIVETDDDVDQVGYVPKAEREEIPAAASSYSTEERGEGMIKKMDIVYDDYLGLAVERIPAGGDDRGVSAVEAVWRSGS